MRIWVPGAPAHPGTLATVRETETAGWASGAISIYTTNENGGYEFYVPASVVGVVCGLTDSFAGTGYRSINHALMFSRGTVSLVEFGVTIEEVGSYGSGDKFTIWRQGADVHVSQNGVRIARRPSTLGASFRLASSLYLKDDTIVNAKAVSQNTGVAESTLLPIVALGMDGASNFGVGYIGPIVSDAGAFNHGRGVATLGGIRAVGSNKRYAAGSGTIGPLTAYGEAGVFAPGWAMGSGFFGGFATSGLSLIGEVGAGEAALRGVRGMASDYPYGAGEAELEPIFTFGAQALHLSLGLLEHGGGYSVVGFGRQAQVSGLTANLPMPTLQGRFGSKVKLASPRATLAMSATVPQVLRGELRLPFATVAGSGTTGGVGGGNLTLPGRLTTSGRSGGQGAMVASGASLLASGVAGGAARAELSFVGHYTLEAHGEVQQATVWSLSAPSLQVAPSGQAWLVAPAITMVAAGGEIVEASYEAYSINLATGAVTRYTDFAFDNVLRFGDKFFGIRADGVYELAGDTDDGAPIVAQVRTFNTNFGATNIKRVPFMYVSGQVGTDLKVGFVADKGVEYKYPVGLVREQGVHSGRAKAGLGVKGSYYNFSITNEDGQDFQIDRLEAIVDATTVVKA